MVSKLFDRIASAITSLGAVIFVLLMIITGMIFFSHTLFLDVFPSTMEKWEKRLATWVMALAWEFTVLITTVNTRHINKRIPFLMALASGVIVLFFIQAFDDSITGLQMTQRWFVGIIAATINYLYADLFYAKWQERTSSLAMPRRIEELNSKVHELEGGLNEHESALNDSQSRLNEVQSEVKELRSFKLRVDKELTCPHCHTLQPSFGSLHAHKGHCSKNPRHIS